MQAVRAAASAAGKPWPFHDVEAALLPETSSVGRLRCPTAELFRARSAKMSRMKSKRDCCFEPIAGKGVDTLILGSLPGRRSLEMQQYYAHPQNAFWKLISAVFAADASLPYARRVKILTKHRIAVWDVLAA